MALAAGINMPPTRLFVLKHGREIQRYFAVRRFDRAGANRRIHMHSFANMIHTNFRIPATDYADLFKATQALTRSQADLIQNITLQNETDCSGQESNLHSFRNRNLNPARLPIPPPERSRQLF